MSYFPLIPAFAAVVNLGLALFVWTRDVRLRINQVFLLWGVSLAVWNFGAFHLFRVSDPQSAIFYARLTHMGVIFIPVSVLHLSALISRRRLGDTLYAAYGASIALAGINLTDLFIVDARNVGYAWFAVPGPAFWFFLFLFAACTYPALYMIWQARKLAGAKGAKKYNALLLADGLLLTFGTNDLLPIFGITHYPLTHIEVYPWGQGAAGLYGLLVGYSLLHDQLLDIRVSLGRQAATVVRFFFLTSVCYAVFLIGSVIFPDSFTMAGLAVGLVAIMVGAAVAGVFFPRLMGGGGDRFERQILGDRFEYHEQMRQFITQVLDYTDRELLLKDTLKNIEDLMQLSSGHVLLLAVKTHEVRTTESFPRAKGAPPPPIDWSGVMDFLRAGGRYIDFRNPQNSAFKTAIELKARMSVAANPPEFAFAIRRPEILFGALIFGQKKENAPFTQVDVELGEALAASMAVALDRIRLKERTAFLEKIELLSVMGAGLAHDLKNKLQSIITYFQLRGEMPMELSERSFFETGLKDVAIIRAYVDEALFFTQEMKPDYARVHTSTLIARAKELPRMRSGRELCMVTLDDQAMCEIECDLVMLRRVLDNLVGNALDASENGQTIRVFISALPETSHRGKWIQVKVTDTGSGIPQEELGRVFEPYFSTKKTGDKNRGFGLGLSIVERLVYLHGGAVAIDSSVGRGTTVQFEIPAVKPARPSEHPFPSN